MGRGAIASSGGSGLSRICICICRWRTAIWPDVDCTDSLANNNVLEGSVLIQGGLSLRKRLSLTESGKSASRQSVYGLDTLAEKKRRERQHKDKESKRQASSTVKDERQSYKRRRCDSSNDLLNESLNPEWYDVDQDCDQLRNPFSHLIREHSGAREEELEPKRKKRVSAKQSQIQKDNELWERNRMAASGAANTIHVDEDGNEKGEAQTHVLVHNIVPPFLDGRLVATKKVETAVPVRDPNSDLALAARKGSALVHIYREQKERKRAQEKHWQLAGTSIGNILGVSAKPEEHSGAVSDELTND